MNRGMLGIGKAVLGIGFVTLFFVGALYMFSTIGNDRKSKAKESARAMLVSKRIVQKETVAKAKSNAYKFRHAMKHPQFVKRCPIVSVAAEVPVQFKSVFAELQIAHDANDRKATAIAIDKILAKKDWSKVLSKDVKSRLIDIMEWHGGYFLPEVLNFFADTEPDVAKEAMDAAVQMVQDCEDGDEARAKLVEMLAPVISDEDAMDAICMVLNDMRPIVRAKTALTLLDCGNEISEKIVIDNYDFLFSDFEHDNGREGIVQYMKIAEQYYLDNPDIAELDVEMYGPTKFNEDN